VFSFRRACFAFALLVFGALCRLAGDGGFTEASMGVCDGRTAPTWIAGRTAGWVSAPFAAGSANPM
jgi:hypothetical protein